MYSECQPTFKQQPKIFFERVRLAADAPPWPPKPQSPKRGMACGRAGARNVRPSGHLLCPAGVAHGRGYPGGELADRRRAPPTPSLLPLLRLRPCSLAGPPGCPVSGSRLRSVPCPLVRGRVPCRLPLGDAPTGGSGEGGAAGHSRRANCDRRERPEDWERWGRRPGPGGNLVGGPRRFRLTKEGGSRGGEARGGTGA